MRRRAQTSKYDAFIGAGDENNVAGIDSFVGSGVGNTITSGGNAAVLGGGNGNTVSGAAGFLGAGDSNTTAGFGAFVGAGFRNDAAGDGSFIGGGGYLYYAGGATLNQATGIDAFIGAGDQNTVSGTAGFIGSGYDNTVKAMDASILGGVGNSAKGEYAAVAGGYGNGAAGELSFAAGYHADASNAGSFVWSDYKGGSALVKDSAANQFVARASGGFHLYSNEDATTGVELTPGSGAWANLSDRNAKTNIAPLDDESVLAKVAALPIASWQYKSEKGVRHVGPMAQDFYSAFGTGVDNRHITSLDEDGVALAAIQALARKDAKIDRLQARFSALAAQFARVEHRLDALSSRPKN